MRLGEPDVNCIHAFFSAGGFESNGVAFADFVNQTTHVDEDFFLGSGVNDKAKAFGGVEKFYCSGIHCKKRKKCDVAMRRHKGKGFYIKNWQSINFDKNFPAMRLHRLWLYLHNIELFHPDLQVSGVP